MTKHGFVSVNKSSFSSIERLDWPVKKVPGGPVPRDKVVDAETDHLFPSSAEINNEWRHTSNPSMCLHRGRETNLRLRATAAFTLDFLLFLYISHSSYHSESVELLITLHQTRLHVSTAPWSFLGHFKHIKLKLNLQVYFCVVRLKSQTLDVMTLYVVKQLIEALRYKPEGRSVDSRWAHWDFLN